MCKRGMRIRKTSSMAGENLDGPIGGHNFQAARSTSWLADRSA